MKAAVPLSPSTVYISSLHQREGKYGNNRYVLHFSASICPLTHVCFPLMFVVSLCFSVAASSHCSSNMLDAGVCREVAVYVLHCKPSIFVRFIEN